MQPRDGHGRFGSVPGAKPRREAVQPAPIPHFARHDQRNLIAANARLAEIRFKEASDQRLVTAPENLPSWEWFNPRRSPVSPAYFDFGDPSYQRSALGGWQPQGSDYNDASHSECPRGVRAFADCDLLGGPTMEPSRPKALHGGQIFPALGFEWGPAAAAISSVRGCRFPIGELADDTFHFCNAKRADGSSYCATHAAICNDKKRRR